MVLNKIQYKQTNSIHISYSIYQGAAILHLKNPDERMDVYIEVC